MAKPVNKFFDIRKYVPWNKLLKSGGFILCNGGRNIGKSTDIWNKKAEIWDKGGITIYMRNTEIQVKTAVAQEGLPVDMSKYIVTQKGVYRRVLKNKIVNGEPWDYEVRGEKVCHFVALTTYLKEKSNAFNNVSLIFWEEYNQIEQFALHTFHSFINLMKTIERFKKVTIILIGNRDTTNNEIMTALELEPVTNLTKTVIEQFDINMYFIEVCDSEFKHLNNANTIADKLAQYNRDTRNYVAGGYMEDDSILVLPYNKQIKPTFEPLFRISLLKEDATYGSFNYRDKKCKAIVYDKNVLDDEALKWYKTKAYISLDKRSDIIKQTTILDDDDSLELRESLFMNLKNNNIYFSSFIFKELLENFITLDKYNDS